MFWCIWLSVCVFSIEIINSHSQIVRSIKIFAGEIHEDACLSDTSRYLTKLQISWCKILQIFRCIWLSLWVVSIDLINASFVLCNRLQHSFKCNLNPLILRRHLQLHSATLVRWCSLCQLHDPCGLTWRTLSLEVQQKLHQKPQDQRLPRHRQKEIRRNWMRHGGVTSRLVTPPCPYQMGGGGKGDTRPHTPQRVFTTGRVMKGTPTPGKTLSNHDSSLTSTAVD